MLITHIQLEHIKSYRRATIALGPGTTAIRGHNGAGKSTLVEALGFALFDALPYARSQFIREGEKSGRVVVGFVSAADGRPYEVERRCVASGGGSWIVHDRELKLQVATGKDDVLACLRVHLGLETTLPLEELFENAIAVPQGTFTADFLQPRALRSKKFDALLQVEEYRKAHEELRETERYLRDQLVTLEKQIERLEVQTAELDAWRAERAQMREQRAVLGERSGAIVAERAASERHRAALAEAQAEVTRRDQERERCHGLWQTALAQFQAAEALAQRAAAAQAICARTAPDHARHAQAQQDLTAAQMDARRVAEVRVRLTRAEQIHASAMQAHAQAEERLRQAQAAAAEAARLHPLAERQRELEEQVRAAEEAQRQLAKLERDRAQIAKDLKKAQDDCHTAEEQIAQLEALEPIAALLPERQQALDALKQREAALGEQRARSGQVTAARDRLQRRVAEAHAAATDARERLVAAQRLVPEVAALAPRTERVAVLDRTIAQFQAERDQAEQALHATLGGICPFLKERCLNIERRGVASLEDHFGNEVARHVDRIIPLEREREDQRREVQRLTALKVQADQASDLERGAQAAQTHLAAQLEELATLEREHGALQAALAEAADLGAALQTAKTQHEESFVAMRKSAGLTAQRSALLNARERVDRTRQLDADRQAEIAEARTRAATLPAAQVALRDLGNPRDAAARWGALAATAEAITAEIARYTAQASEAEGQSTALQQELAPFAGLDARISALQEAVAATAAAHEDYLRHEQEARRLPELQAQAAQLRATTDETAGRHEVARAAYAQALAAFDADDLAATQQHLKDLDHEQATIAEKLVQARQRLEALEALIAEGETRVGELHERRTDRDEILAAQSLLAYCRETIRDAGPPVTRALLRQISGEANRIFGEIMGDRSSLLTWTDDYDVTLRSGGYDRTFAQLSGGEQMSAALAVRLALLRTLTRSAIAIFDEPTQNMDGERRANLAEQIRRVRGFEQLLVISHDDTFEEGLDAVIAIRKAGGESLIEGDGTLPLLAPMRPVQATIGA